MTLPLYIDYPSGKAIQEKSLNNFTVEFIVSCFMASNLDA